MRVGILSYPMLFQRDASLRGQVRATLAALERLPASSMFGKVDASLVDPLRENLDDFDVIHVIGAAHANHAVVEAASACGVPVVLSPMLGGAWRRADGARARIADRLLAQLTGGGVQSTYAQMRAALRMATMVAARSAFERRAIVEAFQIEFGKLRLVPRGVDQAWFDADGALFRQRTGIRGEFALMAASVAAGRQQLSIARALDGLALPLVVAGSAPQGDAGCGRQLLALPGVRVLGDLTDQPRLRASVFAAASVFIVPYQGEHRGEHRGDGEGAEEGALAALAAGTPVLIDARHTLDLPDCEYAVQRLRRGDARGCKAAILAVLEAPPLRERVRALVRERSWDHVAARLVHCYADAITLRGPAANVFVGTAGVRKLLARAAR